ncbi:hypothetical protein Droror1_Dr00023216 [Drosera rotundifolia]
MADSVITTEKPTPKITRDQPNLSDCVACNRHINTSGDDRLRLLTSLWRIVLLCKHCFRNVESGNLCSYCFQSITITTPSNENEVRRCTRCDRGIHEECLRRFEKCPPWKFMGLGGSDCVCVDCWMPKGLERECGAIRVRKGKGQSESCGNGEKRRRRRKLLEEADSVARKKVAVAAEAKENALLKAVAARSAVELASGALDLVAKRKSGDLGSNTGAGVDGEGEGSDVVVVDDAQLAFQLHRAMNSSPRIARNLGFSDGGFRRRGKGSERNGASCLGRGKGGLGSELVSGMCGLGSEAGVQTSSSSKSMNLGGHDGSCLDAESGSCVEQHKACSGETEQKCCEKPTANVNSLDVQDDRYLRKYCRK